MVCGHVTYGFPHNSPALTQARKPLRSKHCRTCDRCIARSDQFVDTPLYVHLNINKLPLTPATALGFGIVVRSHVCPSTIVRLCIIFAVGANNHRQFILFITTLVIGIILFDYLAYACMSPCAVSFFFN